MEIERTTFGTITIDGKTYEHDVIIRLSGEVARRKKKLSKKYYGRSHEQKPESALKTSIGAIVRADRWRKSETALGQKAKIRGNRRISALASRADVSSYEYTPLRVTQREASQSCHLMRLD